MCRRHRRLASPRLNRLLLQLLTTPPRPPPPAAPPPPAPYRLRTPPTHLAEYFKVRLVRLPVGPDFRLYAAAVRAALTPNTVLVVASAPGFPHGLMDHVEEIAEVCVCGVCGGRV